MALDLAHDRRASVRVWFDDPALAEPVPQQPPPHVWHVLGEDLSETGIRLLSPKLFPVGSRLRIALDPGTLADRLAALGRVVWVEQFPELDRWQVGVEFSELSDNVRSRLREIIAHQRRGP